MSMISELVKEMREHTDGWDTPIVLADLFSRAADTIEMLSEKVREAKQEWIPCSERMPEPYETDENGYMKAYLVQRYSWMYTAVWNERKWILWTIGTKLKGVTAWMPLPESYKGESDETD